MIDDKFPNQGEIRMRDRDEAGQEQVMAMPYTMLRDKLELLTKTHDELKMQLAESQKRAEDAEARAQQAALRGPALELAVVQQVVAWMDKLPDAAAVVRVARFAAASAVESKGGRAADYF